MTRATVIVPTHDHATTLDVSVGSALAQTVPDLEVLVLGDGVTDEVRSVSRDLVSADSRVRFLDLPKGEHHGEAHRDRAVREASSPCVFYLCDDDLLLPEHVESLLSLLEDHDLVNSLNGYLAVDGTFVPYFCDLSWDGFHRGIQHPQRNGVSLTGTAHTVAAYERLPVGWETTPPGRWPDHYMWLKLINAEGFRGATSDSYTAVQLPTHLEGRQDWTAEDRRAEVISWRDRLVTPQGRADLDRLVRQGLNTHGTQLWTHFHTLTDRDAEQRAQLANLRAELADARNELIRQISHLR